MPSDSGSQVNQSTGSIITAAIKVHRALGPGLLESAYNICLLYELRKSGLQVDAQRAVPIIYDGVALDCGYRLDMVIDDRVMVELKAIDRFAPIHLHQMLTYLKLTGYAVGLVINFNVPLLKQGIKRVVNSRALMDVSLPNADALR